MPKNKDPIWTGFECIRTKNSGLWARCRKCSKEMQGILSRLKKHSSICNEATEHVLEAKTTDVKNKRQDPFFPMMSSIQSNANKFQRYTEVITTTDSYEEMINLQIAKYFYASNTAFNYVEHEEFIKLCSLLQPGYKPPSAYEMGNLIVNKVHLHAVQENITKIKQELSLHLQIDK